MTNVNEEVAASMARIKALQAMLQQGGADDQGVAEEEDEDVEPYDYEANQTEEDIRWREEQEREWERKAAEERAAAAAAAAKEKESASEEKEKSSSSAASASAPFASAIVEATPASSSSSSSSTSTSRPSPPLPNPPAAHTSGTTAPHEWSSQHLVDWVNNKVKSALRSRTEVFRQKGWSDAEVKNWLDELDVTFQQLLSTIQSNKLTGAEVAKWDVTSAEAWTTHLPLTNPYHRAALWAYWKEEVKAWQEHHQSTVS